MKSEIIAGDTLDFETTVTDYPATDGWTLKFRLVPRVTGTPISITCTTASDGVSYRAQVAPATTAAYVAGDYTWNSWVEKSGARQTVESGQVTILPDPAITTAPFDNRSHARKVLAAIEAVLEGRATKDQEEYTIKDRSLKRTPVADLLTLKMHYQREVAREDNEDRIKNGLGTKAQFRVRF